VIFTAEYTSRDLDDNTSTGDATPSRVNAAPFAVHASASKIKTSAFTPHASSSASNAAALTSHAAVS
jgi:hypothetical protein